MDRRDPLAVQREHVAAVIEAGPIRSSVARDGLKIAADDGGGAGGGPDRGEVDRTGPDRGEVDRTGPDRGEVDRTGPG